MIRKIGLAAVENNKLLLVKKKGLAQLIMPGGKIEAGETPEECIRREIKEELDSEVKDLKFLGKFADKASGSNDVVSIELYAGKITGKIKACNEIESVVWFSGGEEELSPIVKNKILPFLKL